MTRRVLLARCLTSIFCTAALGATLCAANRSVYTRVDRKSCTSPTELTTEFRARGLGVQECRGTGGWRLLVVASDANTWIELRSPRVAWSGEDAIIYKNPIGQFPSIASSSPVEWRIDSAGEPTALIVRIAAQSQQDSRTRVTRLLVVRLERERACVIGRAVTNTEARRLADGGASCGLP